MIGTASLDVLHFAGRTEQAAGGAGLYTALAACRAGAKTGLLAPRLEPLPELLRPVAGGGGPGGPHGGGGWPGGFAGGA